MTAQAEQQLLDADQVARLVHVNKQTVLRWHRTGSMPQALRISDRTLRWSSRAIDAWLLQRQKQG